MVDWSLVRRPGGVVMVSRRYGIWLVALLLAGAVRAAEPTPLMPPAGQKADAAVAPADPAADAKQVVLPYAKYKELLDEIDRLKAKSKPLPPAKCLLDKGRVEGGLVFFTAHFEFHAKLPDAVFALACGQAKADAATTAGRPDATSFVRRGRLSGPGRKARRLSGEPRPFAAALPTARRTRTRTRPAGGGHDAGNGPAGRRPRPASRRQGTGRNVADL